LVRELVLLSAAGLVVFSRSKDKVKIDLSGWWVFDVTKTWSIHEIPNNI
jgi:hypothetical protein